VPTATFYPVSHGVIYSSAGDYSSARAGSGLVVATANQVDNVGQRFDPISGLYSCWEIFIDFNTAELDDGALISAVSLTMNVQVAHQEGSGFGITVYSLDWGATLEAADWTVGGPGVECAAKPAPGPGTFTFDNTAAFPDQINKTGHTRLYVISDRQVDSHVPPGNEFDALYTSSAEQTAQRPKLVVTYTIPGATLAPPGIAPGGGMGLPSLVVPNAMFPPGIAPGGGMGLPSLVAGAHQMVPPGIGPGGGIGTPGLAIAGLYFLPPSEVVTPTFEQLHAAGVDFPFSPRLLQTWRHRRGISDEAGSDAGTITIAGHTFLGGRWAGPLDAQTAADLIGAGYADHLVAVEPGQPFPNIDD
jgi:hypothetical protein